MECDNCNGSGKVGENQTTCFFCDGWGHTCDHCGESCEPGTCDCQEEEDGE